MPQGLEIYNANGIKTLDSNSRVGIILGFQEGIPTSGSITDPNLANGEPFYFTQMMVSWSEARGFILPDVTINGTTISWSNAGIAYQWRIMWGIR